MRRRDFLSLLGSAVSWPVMAVAQPSKVWRIGMLDTAPRDANTINMAAFLKGLRDLGYVEGQNLFIVYRPAGGRSERIPELIAALRDSRPDLVVVRGMPEAVALKAAALTIPIVFTAVLIR